MKYRPFRRFFLCISLMGACIFSTVSAQGSTGACLLQNDVIKVDSSSIHYFKVGVGKPIMLLHGLFAQKEQWTEFACQLTKSGFMVLAPDLPGYGQSTGFPIETYRLTREVELIHQFAQKLALSSFDIAGNSMGGAIAAMYANAYPDEIKTIAFIGAPMGIVGWSPQIHSAIYKGVNPFIPITVDQFDLEMSLLFAKPPMIDQVMKEAAVSEYVSNNRHYQQVWDIVNLELFVLSKEKSSPKPAFITWGKKDGVFNISGKTLLDKKYPKHTSFELQEVAHLAMLERPREIADLYLSFLSAQK